MTELKLCPFCGNKDLKQDYSEYDATTDYWIECEPCEIIVSRGTKSGCIESWNKRVHKDWGLLVTVDADIYPQYFKMKDHFTAVSTVIAHEEAGYDVKLEVVAVKTVEEKE